MRKPVLLFLSLFFFLSFCSQPQRQPNEVRVRLSADPENLNPISYQNAGAEQVINLIFQSLLDADLADDQIKPVLAEAMPLIERVDSFTHITYTIRKEATWNNGSPVEADDVAFTLKLSKAPLLANESVKSRVDFITDIVIDQENKQKFTLICEGYMPEMELLSGDYFILPEYLFDPEGVMQAFALNELTEANTALANNQKLKEFAAKFNGPAYSRDLNMLKGSGGYTLEEWNTGKQLILSRKAEWWGHNTGLTTEVLTASPARIAYQIIPDNTTALLALKNKQLDVLENISATEFSQLQQDQVFLEEYVLYTPNAYDFVYVGINSRLPKFSDKRTRQAIAHLLDVESFIKVTEQNYATLTAGPVPPSVEKYYHKQLQPYTYNLEKATNLLKSAGWTKEKNGWYKTMNGVRQQLTIEIIYKAGDTAFENASQIFQQTAARAGIPVTVQAHEVSLLGQLSRSHEFDMFFRSLSGNPFIFNFKPLLHTSYAEAGGFNYTGFGTPESDQLLDEINKEGSEEQKAVMLRRLQEIIHEEAAFIPLFYQKGRLAVHKRFSNTKISGLAPNYDVSAFTLNE